jgi:hypothetical protein
MSKSPVSVTVAIAGVCIVQLWRLTAGSESLHVRKVRAVSPPVIAVGLLLVARRTSIDAWLQVIEVPVPRENVAEPVVLRRVVGPDSRVPPGSVRTVVAAEEDAAPSASRARTDADNNLRAGTAGLLTADRSMLGDPQRRRKSPVARPRAPERVAPGPADAAARRSG